MAVYLVERNLPGMTMEQLAAAQQAAIDMSRRFSARGESVRYIQSIYLPGDCRCMCLFESSAPEIVAEVNEVAKVPFTRISEALDLTPEDWEASKPIRQTGGKERGATEKNGRF